MRIFREVIGEGEGSKSLKSVFMIYYRNCEAKALYDFCLAGYYPQLCIEIMYWICLLLKISGSSLDYEIVEFQYKKAFVPR